MSLWRCQGAKQSAFASRSGKRFKQLIRGPPPTQELLILCCIKLHQAVPCPPNKFLLHCSVAICSSLHLLISIANIAVDSEQRQDPMHVLSSGLQSVTRWDTMNSLTLEHHKSQGQYKCSTKYMHPLEQVRKTDLLVFAGILIKNIDFDICYALMFIVHKFNWTKIQKTHCPNLHYWKMKLKKMLLMMIPCGAANKCFHNLASATHM